MAASTAKPSHDADLRVARELALGAQTEKGTADRSAVPRRPLYRTDRASAVTAVAVRRNKRPGRVGNRVKPNAW